MKNVIDLLNERGFIEQITSPDLREAVNRPISLYLGFDPTSDSLHLGNLVGLVALSWFQRCGHKVYALIGGATGRIGDPSGKSAERPFLSDAELDHNIAQLTRFLQKILHVERGVGQEASQGLCSDSSGCLGTKPAVLNNNDWLGQFSLIAFLRDVGKHFRIGPMLAKESVRARVQSEEGMSFTEFSYQLLQGYDFHYLHRKYGITLQLGGSDQWGNITAGIECNRKLKGHPTYGLTWPLLTRSDGKKFGKSEEGAIWLSAEKLSPYHFYQYLVRVPDLDVIRLLKMLTFLDMQEIRAIETSMKQPGYLANTAQRKLAEEVTRFVHEEEGLKAALRVTETMAPGGMEAQLSGEMLRELAADMPNVILSRTEVIDTKFLDLFVKAGLVSSKSAARKMIENGGAYLNNERVEDLALFVTAKHLIDGKYLLLSAGKKKRILVKVEN